MSPMRFITERRITSRLFSHKEARTLVECGVDFSAWKSPAWRGLRIP